MAIKQRPSLTNLSKVQKFSKPKTTSQGRSKNTNLARTSSNGRKKRYKGQGR